MDAADISRRYLESGQSYRYIVRVCPQRSVATVSAHTPSQIEGWLGAMLREDQQALTNSEPTTESGGKSNDEQSPAFRERGLDGAHLKALHRNEGLVPPIARESVEVSIKYAVPLLRQERLVHRVLQASGRLLPSGIDYSAIGGLSNEEVPPHA